MADADDSYALDDLGGFLAALRDGADLVMGNRFQGGIEPGAMPFLHRYARQPGAVAGRPASSSTSRSATSTAACARSVATRCWSWACAPPAWSSPARWWSGRRWRTLRIAEVPTTLRPDGRSRAPHLRTWRDGWRHLRFLLAFSPRWLLLYPSMAVPGRRAGRAGVAAPRAARGRAGGVRRPDHAGVRDDVRAGRAGARARRDRPVLRGAPRPAPAVAGAGAGACARLPRAGPGARRAAPARRRGLLRGRR